GLGCKSSAPALARGKDAHMKMRLWFWGLPLAGLLLLAAFAARSGVPAASASGNYSLYLPLVTRPGTSGGNGGTAANFFLPDRPGGSIVTTGQPKVAVDANGG